MFLGLFVSLYAAVERLLLYQDQSNPAYSSKAACRCILLHEFCPALHTILEDGLKVTHFFTGSSVDTNRKLIGLLSRGFLYLVQRISFSEMYSASARNSCKVKSLT